MKIPIGAQHQDEIGIFYKIGIHNKLFKYMIDEWYLTGEDEEIRAKCESNELGKLKKIYKVKEKKPYDDMIYGAGLEGNRLNKSNQIIDLLKKHTLTREEVAGSLNVHVATISNRIKNLVKSGKIERGYIALVKVDCNLNNDIIALLKIKPMKAQQLAKALGVCLSTVRIKLKPLKDADHIKCNCMIVL